MSATERFHHTANDCLERLAAYLWPDAKLALVIYTAGKPELDIVLKDSGLNVDEVVSTLRRRGGLKAIGNKQPELANRIAQFQFRDIRPKAASEISDLTDASLLLGHSKEGITERVYRRVGAIAKPSK